MKILLYSGGQSPSNHQLHDALVGLAGRKKRIAMTYIPFCSDHSEIYYRRFIRRYRRFRAKDFHCPNVDQSFQRSDLSRALNSDIIYLAGGNTFYFLKHLKKSGLLPQLKTYCKEGGVLSGLSAGAVILTPHIGVAGEPSMNPDKNEVGLRDLKGLGLVGFEFHPHFSRYTRTMKALGQYSMRTPYPVMACEDGGGLLIQGERLTIQGKSAIFQKGQSFDLVR